jgi:hypothetical protein
VPTNGNANDLLVGRLAEAPSDPLVALPRPAPSEAEERPIPMAETTGRNLDEGGSLLVGANVGGSAEAPPRGAGTGVESGDGRSGVDRPGVFANLGAP